MSTSPDLVPIPGTYPIAYHTSASEVGEIAAAAGVATVVLVHQLLWGASEQELVDEVRGRFGGGVIYGRDLDVIPLPCRVAGRPAGGDIAGESRPDATPGGG